MFSRIMMVCTGNICRSPLAAAELRRHLPAGFSVRSSGLAAIVGAPAQETVSRLAGMRGLNLGRHEAVQIDEAMALGNDLILVMTASQKDEVELHYPATRGRVFLLGHWGAGEIADPYGEHESLYISVDRQIQTAVQQWLPKLLGSEQ
jgi:protein-tyrosine phosphatase